MKSIYILGTGLSHDGSSCLMKDGKIIVAIEKERLTRKKHDGYNDNQTIQYCLDAAGITFRDISLIVEKNTVNIAHDSEAEILKGERIIPENIPRVKISHHLAHAYSAIGMSPYDEMGVVVMDGRGASLDNCIDVPSESLPAEIRILGKHEWCHYFEKESYYVYQDGKLVPIIRDFSEYRVEDRNKFPLAPNDMRHSIAELYGGASQYIFGHDFSEGKMMGLAPYGREGIYNVPLFSFHDSRVFINYDAMAQIDSKKSAKYLNFWENFQYYADIARWVQIETEKAVGYLFNTYYELNSQKNVAYAGGLALNAVCNSKLIGNSKFDNFYIQPAAGDNGLAVGCCYYGWLEVLKKEKIRHSGSIYFGKTYNSNEIESALEKNKKVISWNKNKSFIEAAAKNIAQGKVIAWFQDGAEFGPRALGNRSILADPRQEYMQDYINKAIKKREEFRPFAPAVLQEKAREYFVYSFENSYYMILVGEVKKECREMIPAVVHVDSSARVQTVSKEIAPKFYKLIEYFEEITGLPILLNTSFNGKSMPIIETPSEAIDFYLASKIDVLYINDYEIMSNSVGYEEKTN